MKFLLTDPLIQKAKRWVVDSRQVQPGDLFVALPGAKVDGHLFIEEARQKGAIAALATQPGGGLKRILVQDTLEAMQLAASWKWRQQQPRAVKITGSYAKTTTKHFLSILLRCGGGVFAPEGNANSQIGLAQAILNGNIALPFAVLEMGMTHPGQIARLSKLFPCEGAMITAVDYVHAVNYPSLQAIAQEKISIFDAETKWGLFAYEMPFSNELQKCPGEKKSFSRLSKEADYAIALNEGKATLFYQKRPLLSFVWKIPGRHFLHNAVAAAAAAHCLGVSLGDIRQGLEALTLPPMRFEQVEKKGVLFINDAYNACEASMLAALELFKERFATRKRVAILGSMRELGEREAEAHQKVLEAAKMAADQLFLVGEGFGGVSHWQELLPALQKELSEGTAVLLKGSRFYRLEQLIQAFS